MSITANTLIITGMANNSAIYTNTMQGLNGSNITMCNDLVVAGAVHSERMDVGMTPYMKFTLQSNLLFTSNEIYAKDNIITVDPNLSDMTSIFNMNNTMNLNLAPGSIYNSTTGAITVPVNGLYTIELQASFSNSEVYKPKNGVYWYFENHPNPNARIACSFTEYDLAHSSTTVFLLKDDRIKPVFYSNDSNAMLLANGETFVSWSVAATTTPMHSNYVRLP